MSGEQVIIKIDEEGAISVGAKNIKGAGCAALTREFEAALGSTTSDVKTGEFYQTDTQVQAAKR